MVESERLLILMWLCGEVLCKRLWISAMIGPMCVAYFFYNYCPFFQKLKNFAFRKLKEYKPDVFRDLQVLLDVDVCVTSFLKP